MLVFSTKSSLHLAKLVAKRREFKFGKWESYRFSDDELYVRVKSVVRGKKALVIGSTEAPTENFIELLFLIRAIQENGGFPRVVIPYLGYARANRVENHGELHRLRFIVELLSQSSSSIFVLDIHDEKSMSLFDGGATNLSAIHILAERAKKHIREQTYIIAPDYGARKRAAHCAAVMGLKDVIVLKKKRHGKTVRIEKPTLSLKGKTAVIVDDIFDTGSTLLRAVEIARELGARHVYGLVTHGVFSGNSRTALSKSSIDKLFVTNSLKPKAKHKKIEYVDISGLITKYELDVNIRTRLNPKH